MCLRKLFGGGPSVKALAPIIPAPDNAEATREADLEEALRRRRRGAAANILTSPTGIPTRASTAQLGGVAR